PVKPIIRTFLNRSGTLEVERDHLSLGKRGEELAVRYLIAHRYRIVVTNFIAPINYSLRGRQIFGEIDIVAYDESSSPFTLAFIEVKTSSNIEVAEPEAAVDLNKQLHIVKAARVYRRLMNISDEPYRFDVLGVVVKQDGDHDIRLLRGYFSEPRFDRNR